MATHPKPAGTGSTDALLLRVTPPRVSRDLFARPRLLSTAEPFRDRAVILVQAPPGFGKTSLLAQWRREHLAHGTVVAWLSAQSLDEPQRLVHGLVLAFRTGAGRPTFGHTLLDASAPDGLEAITMWLAELAQAAVSTMLIIDEADRLPEASREVVAYLLRNLPPNLRVVIAARADCNLGVEDLIDYGHCVAIGAPMLRFQVDETLQLVRSRFGERVTNDAAVQLHELTEGWPLGLQLALSVIAAGQAPSAAIAAMSGQAGEPGDRFVPVMLANLATADVDFLTRVAILDPLHPDLCSAVTQARDAAETLVRLSRGTPIFVTAEHGDWMRMHALVRKALRQRFEALAADTRSRLHMRAAAWLEEHGLVEAAAGHALAAGQREKAYELAERSLYEALSTRGRQGAVLEWTARLPDEELDRRPRLLLAAAWSLALSERHKDAGRLVARLLGNPGADDALRCECALISSGGAVYADDPDRYAELYDPWSRNPPLDDPVLLHVHANRSALRALLEGDPGLARLRVQQAPHGNVDGALAYVRRWGEFFVGLSYLWEGQVLLAESLMQPTLAAAEAELGRRSPLTCMLASLQAAALLERDHLSEAAACLANRLDVLEHVGLPETLLLAYRTLARVALAEGAEPRASELLAEMHAVGIARGTPRLCIASLVEQIRMHARRFRSETCRDLCRRLDEAMADPALPRGPLWRRSVEPLVELAHGYAAIAAQDWKGTLESLRRAEASARRMRLGRLSVEVMGLRALALDQRGEQSRSLIVEAADLAMSCGLVRVFQDAHPALGELVQNAGHPALGRPTPTAGPLAAAIGHPPGAANAQAPRSTPSLALTPKEREVLALLARNLTNKEIGLAMQVGEQTIKWHLKNLFIKLDAGTRKQLVQRARILGLIDAAA